MAHTNRGRVILGGLRSWSGGSTSSNSSQTALSCGEAWGQAMQALAKPAELSTGAIVIFTSGGSAGASLLVWLYAAIRSAYGAGPKTASALV